MHIKNRFMPAHSLFFRVLFGILASFFAISHVSAIASMRQTKLMTEANLDEMAMAWNAYTEIPTPGVPTPSWEISNASNPTLDGRSLRCAITGGTAYSNLHCYRNLDADPNSNTFIMSLSFYYRPPSTINNNGGSSIVQALEFTMNKWVGNQRYEWAVQWENVGENAPKWRYWDPHHRNAQNELERWVDLNIAFPREILELEGERWYTLKLEGDLVAGQVHYRRLSVDQMNDGIDGQVFPLDITVDPASEAGDKLAVAVQLDGNDWNGTGHLSPYEVFLDKVTFTHVNGTSVDHIVGNKLRGTSLLSFGQSTRNSYLGVDGGPVQITSTREIPIIAAERVIYKVNGLSTSFTEMMGVPDSQLDNVYWLPWYNNVDLDTQLRFANVSAAPATVTVTIGGMPVAGSPFTLAAGASTRKSITGVNSGPVKIVSTQNIVVAERLIYKVNGVNTSFSEVMGLPENQLSTTYWLPWYNNVDLDTQLRIANVSGSPATVTVTIGGVPMPSFNIAAGESTRKSFTGINNGPVKIVSTRNIVAAERLIYKANGVNTSFTEMMAQPSSQLDNVYWLPWYNNVDLDTQLRIANASNTSATIHIYIGGAEVNGSPFTLAAGASTRRSFTGINNGPVQIMSTQNIIAAERIIYRVNNANTSFTEMMALPDSQLSTTYWFPWYNNVDLDTQLRFGVP